jgi:hypothetical protein
MISGTRVKNEEGLEPSHPGVDHRSMGWLTIDLKADRVLREKFDKRRLLVEVYAAHIIQIQCLTRGFRALDNLHPKR